MDTNKNAPAITGAQTSINDSIILSTFPHIGDAVNVKDTALADIVEMIRTDEKLKAHIERCLFLFDIFKHASEQDKKKAKEDYSKKKNTLPYMTPHGRFTVRNGESCIAYSGLFVRDDDHLGDKLVSVRSILQAHPSTVACFLSPSGDGLKTLFRVDPSGLPTKPDPKLFSIAHKRFLQEINALTGVKADEKGSDLARACFFSHDVNIYYNPSATAMQIPAPPPPVIVPVIPVNTKVNDKRLAGALKDACEKIRTAPSGTANNTMLEQARSMGGLKGMDRNTALQALSNAAKERGKSQEEIDATILRAMDYGATIPWELSNNPVSADKLEMIRDLAKLEKFEYYTVRKNKADHLGIGVSELDDCVKDERKKQHETTSNIMFPEIDPWPEPVDGAVLLDDVYTLSKRFVVADENELRITALWTMLTWYAEYATVLPMLLITAPTKGCGKTVALDTIAEMVEKPFSFVSITSAVLFRTMHAHKPTLFLDEAEIAFRENFELQSIMNASHVRNNGAKRNGAMVPRCEERNGKCEIVHFETWGCKAMAGIDLRKTVLPSLQDRCIIVSLRRKLETDTVENLRHADVNSFHDVKRKMKRWVTDNGVQFASMRPNMGNLRNRAADNYEPLFAIAELAGGQWPAHVRNAAPKAGESTDIDEELLTDCIQVFSDQSIDRIRTAELIQALCADEEKGYAKWNKASFPITPKQLSTRLAKYGIIPANHRYADGMQGRGYQLADFRDAEARYLTKHDGPAVPVFTAKEIFGG